MLSVIKFLLVPLPKNQVITILLKAVEILLEIAMPFYIAVLKCECECLKMVS